MLEFKATSGPTEIVASGTLIAYQSNPITVYWGESEQSQDFKVTFRFTDEEGKEKYRTEFNQIDSHSLEIHMINFKNPLGVGSKNPLQIGKKGNQKIWLHYRVYHFRDSDKTLQFTVYREKQ